MNSDGINLFLQVYGDLGIPIHSREMAKAIIDSGQYINIIPIFPNTSNYSSKELSDIKKNITRPSKTFSSLVFWYPDIYDDILGEYKNNYGYYIFEYTKIPQLYIESINRLDKIYTASDWGCQVLKDNGVKIPVAKFPGGVNTAKFNTKHRKVWDGNGIFRFLHIGKCEERKGTYDLVKAFLNEFRDNKDVSLTLSIDNPHIPGFKAEQWLLDNFGSTTNIKIQHYVGDIRNLYATHHCAVFPTRAEGIGLPIVEAMACGIPTIVTETSGTSEFIDETRNIVLYGEKKPIYDKFFFPVEGQWGDWIVPRVETIQGALKRAYNNYNIELGNKSAAWIEQNFTWKKAIEKFV